MIAGISWILYGFVFLYKYKKSNLLIQKTFTLIFLNTGIIILILRIMNNLFFHNLYVDILSGLIMTISIFYGLYKIKEWEDSKEVMNKLNKK